MVESTQVLGPHILSNSCVSSSGIYQRVGVFVKGLADASTTLCASAAELKGVVSGGFLGKVNIFV